MKIKLTSQLLTAVILLFSGLAIVCALSAQRNRANELAAFQKQETANSLIDQLALTSDRLSDTIRAYASTGDHRYHDELQKELRGKPTFQALRGLGLTPAELTLLTRAQQSFDNLAQFEDQVLAAVANQDRQRATELVYSPEYDRARAAITQPILECRQMLDQRLDQQASELAERAALLARLALATLVLTILTVAAALTLFYQRRVVDPLVSLSLSMQELLAGKAGAHIGHQRDHSEVGDLARSMEQYRVKVEEAERRRWVATNVAELSEALQGAEQHKEFGQRVLSKLVPLVGGGYGALHLLHEGDGRYHLTSDYGTHPSQEKDRSFAPGAGIPGQAVVDRKPVLLADIPANYVSILSGLGESQPKSLAVIPIQTQDRVLAVLEIASLSVLSKEHLALLEEAAGRMALQLEVLLRNQRTRELLEQVRITEERTRLILDSTSEGIFGVDTRGVIDFVNEAACRILGRRPEEMIGQPSHQLIHHHHADGSEYPMTECPMYFAYTRGETSRIDNEVLWHKDGSMLAVEYGATPIRKAESLVGAVISFTDITERKRMEQELRHQAFLSDSALELTRAGYWHVPLDGSGWYNSSERAVRIFGDLPSPGHRYRLDDWAAHVFEGDETAARETMGNFQAAVAGTIPAYDAVYAYKRPVDGTIAWIHALGQVVKDASGKPIDMYGVTQDITRIKLAELEIKANESRLRETEEFYRSVLERAPDGLMVVDSEGIIRLANFQSEKLFGYERGELIGQPVEHLVPREARAGHPAQVRSFHREQRAREMGSGRELCGVRKDGSLFPLEIGLSPLPAQPGKGPQVAVSIRDISERKEQQKSLIQAKTRAENVVRMANLLAESDQSALQYLESERDLFAWLFSPEDLARFEQLLEGRSFSEAGAMLQQAMKRLEPASP